MPITVFGLIAITCIALTAIAFAAVGPGCGGTGGTMGNPGSAGCNSAKGPLGGTGGAAGGGNGGNGNNASNINGGGTYGAGGGGGGGGFLAGNGGIGGRGGDLDNLGSSGGSFAGNGGNGGNGGDNPTGVAGNGGNGGRGGTLLNNSSGGSSGGTGGRGGMGGNGLIGGQGGAGGKGGNMNKVGAGAGMIAGDGGAGGNGGASTGSGAGGSGGPGGTGGDATGPAPILGGTGGTGGAGGPGCAGPGQAGSAGSMTFSTTGGGGAAGGAGGPACIPPSAPTITPTCTANSPSATIDWSATAGLTPTSFTVDIDNDNFSGDWIYKDVSSGGPGPYSTAAPVSFVATGASAPAIPLSGGTPYQVRINYRASSYTSSDVFSGTQTFTARSDCAAPVPPPPTVTPTCTANKPTFDITWNAVAGLSPTSFTVDMDDNNFAGGTDWLYKDVPSTGPGPYSANSAPNSFLSFGVGPAVPLNPGSSYQFRVNYRGAGPGGANVVSPTDTKTARTDCIPPPSITCVSVNPSIVEASPTPYDVQVGYQNASGSAALTGATVTARVATAPMQSTATAVSPNLPGDGSVRLAPLLNIVTPIPGEYDVSLVFTGGNTPGSPLTVNCAQKLAAYNGPYFRVFGGDVMTGGYSSATCSAWPVTLGSNGSIFAFNKSDGTPATSGKGAGAQLLVQAMATVNGFSSAQHRTSPPYPPAPQPAHDKGLTFANASASQFGGAFNIGSCPPDYFANKSYTAGASNPLVLPPASQVSGPYIVNAGSVTSSPVHTISNGKSIVLYVNGNAYITGDIVYQTGPWSLVNDIPSFTLVAKGNIYITENVTRLDGIYIAQPVSVAPGDGGTLYTCSITPPAVPTAAQVASQCTSPLTINGAVMARSVKLLRSSGTAREANPADCPLSLPASNIYNCTGSSTAAEQFIYTPEIWIRSNFLRRFSRPSSYDVVSNLPPIL